MEETTCPLTEGKAIEICSENFGDDCGYILENLFIKCRISAFNPAIDIINNIDIEEKTKLAGKLANFSMDYALNEGITYKVENSNNYPIYNEVINEEFLKKVKQEPMPNLNQSIEFFLQFLRNREKIFTEAANLTEIMRWDSFVFEKIKLEIFFCAISYTKKKDWEQFLKHLEQENFVDKYQVTVNGQKFLEEKRKNQESKKVFVAMWFNEKVNFIYEQAVEPAIRECNYEPERIDRVEHNNIIDDEIIANIKQSKFIIADFTAEKDKPRGGVYYEAGFADGFGIPVILTCRKDLIENKEIHFDLEHRNFIWWEENKMEDFKEKLIKRIKATID